MSPVSEHDFAVAEAGRAGRALVNRLKRAVVDRPQLPQLELAVNEYAALPANCCNW